MLAKIIDFGIKLNGRYGITGELIANFSDADIKSQVERCIARKRTGHNGVHDSIMVVCATDNDLATVRAIIAECNAAIDPVWYCATTKPSLDADLLDTVAVLRRLL